jgi:hypothetical protein
MALGLNAEICKVVKYVISSVEICCMCGTVTIAGIYTLVDPQTVYFFGEDSEKNFEFKLDNVIDDE